jgi:hypothetical protein
MDIKSMLQREAWQESVSGCRWVEHAVPTPVLHQEESVARMYHFSLAWIIETPATRWGEEGAIGPASGLVDEEAGEGAAGKVALEGELVAVDDVPPGAADALARGDGASW